MSENLKHEFYMKIAFEQALLSFEEEEVPVGCVIVRNDEIISKSHNKKEKERKVTSHAEIIAIEKANQILNSWRLNNCDIYVTLEPCPMCAGAIIQSRFSNVIFASKSPIYGSLGSVIDISKSFPDSKNMNVIYGVYEEKCSELIKNFFRKR